MKITAEDFCVWYKKSLILNNISLAFPSKKISAIIGPSGCGKTTLLKCINRTAELDDNFKHSGDILLEETSLYSTADPAYVRKTVGMVFQKPIIFPFSIKENVLFGPRYFGIGSNDTADDLTELYLTKVGLWNEVKDKLSHSAKELSGGQQQRLCIARVLANEPKVLLLDEPCSNLDIVSTRLIEELLLSLAAQFTIILVTHNLAQAKRIADTTIFMSNGRLVEAGYTADFFSAPKYQETIEFLALQ